MTAGKGSGGFMFCGAARRQQRGSGGEGRCRCRKRKMINVGRRSKRMSPRTGSAQRSAGQSEQQQTIGTLGIGEATRDAGVFGDRLAAIANRPPRRRTGNVRACLTRGRTEGGNGVLVERSHYLIYALRRACVKATSPHVRGGRTGYGQGFDEAAGNAPSAGPEWRWVQHGRVCLGYTWPSVQVQVAVYEYPCRPAPAPTARRPVSERLPTQKPLRVSLSNAIQATEVESR